MKRSNYNRDGQFTGAVNVPQTMLLLMSKLAQAKGYAEGVGQGALWYVDHKEKMDPKQMHGAINHIVELLDEAVAIEKELRVKLRARGEEC